MAEFANERPTMAGKFDVYVIAKDGLAVARLKGVFDAFLAEKLIEFVETKEITTETGFNRFCDMSQLEGIQLSSQEVRRLAARRRLFNPNDIRVKSAFFAPDPLAFGIARMYEQTLNSQRIEVRVWGEMQAAAAWLQVDLDRLMF